MNLIFRLKKTYTLVIIFAVFGLLGFFVYPQKATASAPADLAVGMALQQYGVSGTVPLNYGAKVSVVPKRTSNGINIPIAGSPYNGKHLAPGGGNPTTNSIAFGVDASTQNNIFGGTFYQRSYSNLIWCGNSVGVPDQEFELDVSVGFATGNRQTINYGGRNYTGKWIGYWHFEGTGSNDVNRFFEGYSARVPALNPYRTFVFFVFQEDPPPPPPTYDGTIQTNKRLADGTLVPWNGGAANPPFSSFVELINPNGGVFGGSNSNPSTTTPVWVKWDNHQSNEEGKWVSDRVAVPSGWRIKGVATSLEGQPLANDGLSCTGANNTGSCTVKGLTVRNGKATFVDWFYEKIPPKLELSCTSDTPTAAGKITISASTNIPGDPTTATVLADYDKNPPTTPKTLTTGSDSFEFNKDYRDDAQHTYNVSYQGLTKSITFGPNVPNSPPAQCNIKAWYYPWLQTENGDVVANGKIIGQQSGYKRLGSRLPTQKEKEAEYLIIASFYPYAEGGSNFCSTYNYILTNPNATKGNCTNGFGYTLNNNTLGNGNDDNVTKGVAQAYDAFPALCKSNNPSDLAAISVSLSDCPDGKIYRINGGDLPAINVKQGRATILVDGDVNINKTISYATNVGGGNPKDQPNLAIVVKGSAKIFSNVDTIKSSIYSTGEINTCQANSASFCKKSINVIGSLIAKNGFKFNRVFYSKETPSPAESITLNPVSILYPPPGISSEYFVGYNNGASIDSGEFQPRF